MTLTLMLGNREKDGHSLLHRKRDSDSTLSLSTSGSRSTDRKAKARIPVTHLDSSDSLLLEAPSSNDETPPVNALVLGNSPRPSDIKEAPGASHPFTGISKRSLAERQNIGG